MKPKSPGHGSIAKKILAGIRRHQNVRVVNLESVRAGQAVAALVVGEIHKEHSDLPPAHAIYISVTNALMTILENIQDMPPLHKLSDRIAKEQEEYAPQGPPMSPLSATFFWNWALYDLSFGPARETFGSVFFQVGQALGMDAGFLSVLHILNGSRLGLYVHEGVTERRIQLRELVTGQVQHCWCASGHLGKAGELWLARVLPPPGPGFRESVVVTTPYVILAPGVVAWEQYLERTLFKTGVKDRQSAYAALLKHGITHNHWCEYVVEAYVNHNSSVILLEGLPDVEESRPHSRASERKQGELTADESTFGAAVRTPPGNKVPTRKISETLLDFAQPILARMPPNPSPQDFKMMLRTPWVVWNAVVVDDNMPGPSGNMMQKARQGIATLPAPDRKLMYDLFDMLEARKRSQQFAHDRRMIGDVSVRCGPDGAFVVTANAHL